MGLCTYLIGQRSTLHNDIAYHKKLSEYQLFCRTTLNFFSWSALHCATTLSSEWCLSDERFGLCFLMHYASCADFYSGYRNIETQRACKM